MQWRQRRGPAGIALALVLAAAALPLRAQDAGELEWQWRAEPVAGTHDVELVFTAPIRHGWIVYGSDFEAGDFGPRPARVAVHAGGEVLQPARSVGAHARSDRNFAGEYRYTYFADAATFRQRVRVEPGAREVSGVLNGQSCHEESGLCTLFRAPFAVALE
ncbi:disulfide bond formation protein DsbD [Pseudoxanthomonas broegbernensis]|uniref:Disulfide bond formation protein DsbD n=2 Tax=Pseudoxanthomonas broegbernensis TaxID=83619 RepID=A0A7V8GNL8_9GAMM|nr:disulfide bond formation protein DsbD [Pseudoxanthomonas broegbernensis]